MLLSKDDYNPLAEVKNNAQTLFTEIATYKELDQNPQKTAKEKELQYYLGFRILDALYNFQNPHNPSAISRDTKFSGNNYNQLFTTPPDRNLINGLRNRLIHDQKMNFDQALLDQISRDIVSKFKPCQFIEPRIEDNKLSDTQKETYHQAYQVTKNYSAFIADQVSKFAINPDLTRTAILEKLKDKSGEIKQKQKAAKAIVKESGITATVKSPNIVDAIDDLNTITNSLIHGKPKEELIVRSSKGIDAISQTLDLAYGFLNKEPQKIAEEAILEAQSKQEERIKSATEEKLNQKQAEERQRRAEITEKEESELDTAKEDESSHGYSIEQKLQKVNGLIGEIEAVKKQIGVLEAERMALALKIGPNNKKLKESQNLLRQETSDFIKKISNNNLYKLFNSKQNPDDIETALFEIVNNSTDTNNLKTKIKEYIDEKTSLDGVIARSAGSKDHKTHYVDTITEALCANPAIKSIFECNLEKNSISKRNLVIAENLKELGIKKQAMVQDLQELQESTPLGISEPKKREERDDATKLSSKQDDDKEKQHQELDNMPGQPNPALTLGGQAAVSDSLDSEVTKSASQNIERKEQGKRNSSSWADSVRGDKTEKSSGSSHSR